MILHDHPRWLWLRWKAVAWLMLVPAASAAYAQCPIQFRDVIRASGVTFRHTDGSSGRWYTPEAMTGGIAMLDYDGDGRMDIYFLNGAPMKGTQVPTMPTNALYRNEGGLRFTDVTEKAGVGDTGFGLGVAVGDYNNDGHTDIYVNNYGTNVLYRNNGDGTFTDVTAAAGVGDGHLMGAGANFFDMDADGDLDLFVGHYLPFSYDNYRVHSVNGYPAHANPKDYHPMANALYRNNGDGTFTDVSKDSGIAAYLGKAMGTVCFDYDGDGDTDIVVANDLMGNFLFQNNGSGKFEEVGLMAGVAYDLGGAEQSSMGIACADYDNDGRLDLNITSFQGELATLYRNSQFGLFDDVTRVSGAGSGTLADVTWGNGFADFDNDGDRDLLIACGHLLDNIELYDDTTNYHARNVLLMNTGNGRFVNVSDQCGDGMKVKLSSRGLAIEDLDGDGDPDAVILNSRREPTILKNESAATNHWVQVRLRGVKTNRDGIGARVKVVAGDLTQIDEVHSGQGYQSHFGMRPHFGLGRRDRIDRIEVRWIGGGVDVLQNVGVDRLITITEGDSSTAGQADSTLPIRRVGQVTDNLRVDR